MNDTQINKVSNIIPIFLEEPVMHPCPYQTEINGNWDFRCDCGEESTHQCAMDI